LTVARKIFWIVKVSLYENNFIISNEFANCWGCTGQRRSNELVGDCMEFVKILNKFIWPNSRQAPTIYLSLPPKRNSICCFFLLSCVATSVLRMRLLLMVAFLKKLRWLAQTKVFTLKTQLHAVNARWKRLSQLSFSLLPNLFYIYAKQFT